MSKNFQITDKETGKSYWISRAMAVAGVIYTVDEKDNVWFLVEKRGPGCPDFIGYNALVCGYLDWDETLPEAMYREIYEELGLKLDRNNSFLQVLYIQDDPKDNIRQNVTVRFLIGVDYDIIKQAFDSGEINTRTEDRGGEPDEVDEILLVSVDNLSDYKWAWNHDEVIKTAYDALGFDE